MSKIKMNNKQNIENHLIALVRRGANNITKLAITRQTQMGGNRVNAVQCAVHIKRREHRTQKNSKQNPVSKQVVGNSERWKVETIRYDIVTQQANRGDTGDLVWSQIVEHVFGFIPLLISSIESI